MDVLMTAYKECDGTLHASASARQTKPTTRSTGRAVCHTDQAHQTDQPSAARPYQREGPLRLGCRGEFAVAQEFIALDGGGDADIA